MVMWKELLRLVCICTVVQATVGWGSPNTHKFDPCCSYPCENRATCLATKDYEDYVCDCYGLPYYGRNCEIPTLIQRVTLLTQPGTQTMSYLMSNYRPIWRILQSFQSLTRSVFKTFFLIKTGLVDNPPLYATDERGYTTLDTVKNRTYFARALPPVPKNCPKPMGIHGRAHLPAVDEVVEKLFRRREFIPNSLGASLMFAFFAQHFTHQVLKTDFEKGPGYTFGAQVFDGSQIYGNDKHTENMLRSMEDGKMKLQTLNGEEYPPYLKDVPVEMIYPGNLNIPEERKFALGHRFFGMLPGLFLFNTVYLREHNRVCDILKQEYPHWDDERLFQTAKLVVLGEHFKVLSMDYLAAITNFHLKYKFDPTVFHGEVFNYATRVFVEFNHLYHWHQLVPDQFVVDGVEYSSEEYQFHNELVVKHGTRNFTDALSRQRAGEITLRNHGPSTLDIVRRVLEHSRSLRMQPFNEYRKRFGLPPYSSIDEITDNAEYRQILKDMYGDINGVEFFVGLMAESRLPKGLFGVTMYDIVAPYALQGFFSCPILSPGYFKPSTYGGEVGFNIVMNATTESLFCNNIPGECPYVFLRVPDDVPENNLHKEEL